MDISGKLANTSPIALAFLIGCIVVLFFIIRTEEFNGLLKNQIEYYDFNVRDSYDICFIGSVHGNEPVGCAALMDLINDGFFERQSKYNKLGIRVIPCVNKWGLLAGVRYQPNINHADINREFAVSSDPTAIRILELINGAGLVVDIHEGYDFHKINPRSMGSTISPTLDEKARRLAIAATDAVNKTILQEFRKYEVLFGTSCDISGTLSCNRQKSGKSYILIETTGQNNIQPLELRKQQVKIIVGSLISNI